MNPAGLLRISAREIQFRDRVNASASFKLMNSTTQHVAYKITAPNKYHVQRPIGVLSPRMPPRAGRLDLHPEVWVRATMVAPAIAVAPPSPNIGCRDEFSIQTLAVEPGTTPQQADDLFNEGGPGIQTSTLPVLVIPPIQGSGLLGPVCLILVGYLIVSNVFGSSKKDVKKNVTKEVSNSLQEWVSDKMVAIIVAVIFRFIDRFLPQGH